MKQRIFDDFFSGTGENGTHSVNLDEYLLHKWTLKMVPLSPKHFDVCLEAECILDSSPPGEPTIEGNYEVEVQSLESYGYVSYTIIKTLNKVCKGTSGYQVDGHSKLTVWLDIKKCVGFDLPYSMSPMIELNIGGAHFETTKETINNIDCLLKFALTFENAGLASVKDKSDCLFFDRDPKHFRIILTYLRDQNVILPEKGFEIAEIQEEAKFYMLNGLVQMCAEKLSSMTLQPTPEMVKLDIGGTVFKTTKATLTRFDGMFKTMLDNGIMTTTDGFLTTFIDRSPKHFDLLLNYMRDGDVALPESFREIKEILKEAQYYLLGGLVQICEELIG